MKVSQTLDVEVRMPAEMAATYKAIAKAAGVKLETVMRVAVATQLVLQKQSAAK